MITAKRCKIWDAKIISGTHCGMIIVVDGKYYCYFYEQSDGEHVYLECTPNVIEVEWEN